MGETQEQRAARQEQIARQALPQFSDLALQLEELTEEVFARRISFQPDNGADVMVLSFVTKQHEHLRSVRILVAEGLHRDAFLIARTMLEGLGRLLWAFRAVPERTELWFWYGVILDWRQTLKNIGNGLTPDPDEMAELKALVDKYGPNYYTPKVRKARRNAERNGTVFEMPDDPWDVRWTNTSIAKMFEEIGGKDWYDSIYAETSEWVHWGPRAILRAMETSEDSARGFSQEDSRAAARALNIGSMCLLDSLRRLDEHFALGITDRLTKLDQLKKAIEAESLAAAY